MLPHSIKYWIGTCGDCGQGQLVIGKDIENNCFLIICDDCEAEWKVPDTVDKNRLPRNMDRGDIKNATLEEIQSIGWEHYITGNAIDYECV